MTKKRLATIIINHNHGEMIKKTIESLFALSPNIPFNVFVLNNVRDEGTKIWITKNFPMIQLLENDSPKGFASNVNRVIKHNPDFDYYLLLNPDVICLHGMIDSLITVMEKDSKIGAVGPLLLNFDGTIQPSRRRFASFLVLVFRVIHLDKIFKNIPIINQYLMSDHSFEDVTEVDWITGAAMVLRKTALDQVGLMDERFFLYFEDEDICCRMWRSGWKVCYIIEAKAFHAHIAEGRNKLFSKANHHHIMSAFKMFLKYKGRLSRRLD